MNENNILNKLSEEYSEGDIQLQNTLLNLWKNGIETYACCKGHDMGSYYHIPYIAMYLDNNNLTFFKNLYESIYLLDDGISIEFNYRKNIKLHTCCIYMRREENKTSGLNYINDCLNNKEIKIKNDNFDNIIFLLEYAKDNEIDMEYSINSKKMNIWFKNPKEKNISDNIYLLSEELNKMKENSKIPYIPMECDENNLNEFVNLIKNNKFNQSKLNLK